MTMHAITERIRAIESQATHLLGDEHRAARRALGDERAQLRVRLRDMRLALGLGITGCGSLPSYGKSEPYKIEVLT